MARGFRFFSLEALRSIKANAAISFAATATVLIAIATLGIFLAVFSWSQSQINGQKDKLDLRAFIKLDASPAEMDAAVQAVQSATHVKKGGVSFKSRDQVLAYYRGVRDQLFAKIMMRFGFEGGPSV